LPSFDCPLPRKLSNHRLLLRARRERPHSCRAAEQHNEIASM
jgi:hypothetical protein